MDAAVEAEALLVMATIESNVTWNMVDYSSPIKIGVVQWAGSEAAALLDSLDATDKSTLEQSLIDDLTTYGTGSYWASRYLSKDEGNSIIDTLGSPTAETTQRLFFSTMITQYETIMADWGCNTNGTVQQQKAFIFLSCVYHLSIAEAGRIVSAIGAGATTEAIYAAIMNGSLSTWRNWWTVKTMLDEWTGVEPTVSGDTTDPDTDPGGSGQENVPIIQVESQIQKIGYTGQQLIIYGKDNPDGVVCYRATNSLWYPSGNTAAPPTPTPIDPPTPPEPEPPATQTEWEQMRQLWYDNEEAWYYSQGPGRMDPPASGYSDCSASIIWAVSQIRPDLGQQLGVYTGTMVNAGTEVARGNTGTGAHVDLDILKPGDILLVGNNWTFDNGKSHVEWYFGDGQLWGSGYSPLPHRSGNINDYLVMIANRGKPYYMIRRFL